MCCPVALTRDAIRHAYDSTPHFKSPVRECFNRKNIHYVDACVCLSNGLALRCPRHWMPPRLPTPLEAARRLGLAMAWRFRRSLKLGPLRLNFSKSGIGYSAACASSAFRESLTVQVESNSPARSETMIPRAVVLILS